MANSVPTLGPGTVSGVTGLTTRPVYFLKLNGGPQPTVVVKGENALAGLSDADAEISIRWSSKMMKNINNDQVNTKVMTPAEIVVFNAAARVAYPNPGDIQNANLTQPYRWVKMPYVAGLSDAELYNSAGKVNANTIKPVLQRFLDAQVWTDLGTVVVGDIFSGNNDRFKFDGTGGVAGMTVEWANYGNIMFTAGGATSVIGLDTLDPSGSDGRSNLGSGQADLGVLPILSNANQPLRAAFALKCTRAIAHEIKRRMGSVSSLTLAVVGGQVGQILRVYKENPPVGDISVDDLLGGYAPDFQTGFDAGVNRLKNYLQGKRQNYAPAVPWVRALPLRIVAPQQAAPRKAFPAGVQSRMQTLGW